MLFTSKYLSDPTDDVRIATENLLADFLREIREVTMVQREYEARLKSEADNDLQSRRTEADKDKLPDITIADSERAAFVPENDGYSLDDESMTPTEDKEAEVDGRDLGSTSTFYNHSWEVQLTIL